MCLTYTNKDLEDVVKKIYLDNQTVTDLKDYYKGQLFYCLNKGNQKGIDYFLYKLQAFGVMRQTE